MIRMRDLEIERRKIETKVLKAVGVGLWVYAIQTLNTVFLQKIRGLYIGGNHALFNELVCVVSVHTSNAANLAVIIELEPDLRKIELKSTASSAGFGKRFVQRMKIFDGFLNILRNGLVVALQKRTDLAVARTSCECNNRPAVMLANRVNTARVVRNY